MLISVPSHLRALAVPFGILLVAVVGAVAFATCHRPVKVTETEEKTYSGEANAHVETQNDLRTNAVVDRVIVRRKRAPDPSPVPGCPPCLPVDEETITERAVTSTHDLGKTIADSESTTRAEVKRTKVTEARPGWSATVTAGWDPGRLSSSPDVLEIGIDRRLFGGLWVGVRADTDKRIGASLRVEW